MIPDDQSQSVQIQIALRDATRALKLGGLIDDEIEARDSYFTPGVGPFQGVTIHDIGEGYDAGTLGTHDVAYKIAFTFCDAITGNSIVSSDWLLRWREGCRRRFTDQRLGYGTDEGVQRSIVKLLSPPTPIENVKSFPNHRIHRLVFAVWARESTRVPRT